MGGTVGVRNLFNMELNKKKPTKTERWRNSRHAILYYNLCVRAPIRVQNFNQIVSHPRSMSSLTFTHVLRTRLFHNPIHLPTPLPIANLVLLVPSRAIDVTVALPRISNTAISACISVVNQLRSSTATSESTPYWWSGLFTSSSAIGIDNARESLVSKACTTNLLAAAIVS